MAKSTNQLTGYRHGADVAFGYLANLFACLGLVQVFLAGLAVFGDGGFDIHTLMGRLLSTLAIIIFILALVARYSKFVVIASILLVLLAAGATSAFASTGWSHEWLGGMHALVGVVSVLMAGVLGGRVFKKKTTNQ